MSIEQALAENTAAIRALIETIKSGLPVTHAQIQAVADEGAAAEKAEKKTTAPKAEKKTETPKAEAAEPSAATPEQKAEPAAAEAATYQDAASAITKLSRAKGRDAAVAVLQQFGAAKLPDVKPEQFADVIAAAEEAMA
jgi:hypothetical protein